jgi:hypothetical protein
MDPSAAAPPPAGGAAPAHAPPAATNASPWRAAHALFAESALGDLIASNHWTPAARLVTVRPGSRVGEALGALAAARALSAPVLRGDGSVAGVAEVRAALRALLQLYGACVRAHRASASAQRAARARCSAAPLARQSLDGPMLTLSSPQRRTRRRRSATRATAPPR